MAQCALPVLFITSFFWRLSSEGNQGDLRSAHHPIGFSGVRAVNIAKSWQVFPRQILFRYRSVGKPSIISLRTGEKGKSFVFQSGERVLQASSAKCTSACSRTGRRHLVDAGFVQGCGYLFSYWDSSEKKWGSPSALHGRFDQIKMLRNSGCVSRQLWAVGQMLPLRDKLQPPASNFPDTPPVLPAAGLLLTSYIFERKKTLLEVRERVRERERRSL